MGVNFGTLLYQIALRRTQNSHDWEASKAADRLFSLPQKVELCKGWVMKPQNQFPLAGGTVAGFASSAFSCSLFNICKTQSTCISPIDTGVLNEERERERERERVLFVSGEGMSPYYWSSCGVRWHFGWEKKDILPTSYRLF